MVCIIVLFFSFLSLLNSETSPHSDYSVMVFLVIFGFYSLFLLCEFLLFYGVIKDWRWTYYIWYLNAFLAMSLWIFKTYKYGQVRSTIGILVKPIDYVDPYGKALNHLHKIPYHLSLLGCYEILYAVLVLLGYEAFSYLICIIV